MLLTGAIHDIKNKYVLNNHDVYYKIQEVKISKNLLAEIEIFEVLNMNTLCDIDIWFKRLEANGLNY